MIYSFLINSHNYQSSQLSECQRRRRLNYTYPSSIRSNYSNGNGFLGRGLPDVRPFVHFLFYILKYDIYSKIIMFVLLFVMVINVISGLLFNHGLILINDTTCLHIIVSRVLVGITR